MKITLKIKVQKLHDYGRAPRKKYYTTQQGELLHESDGCARRLVQGSKTQILVSLRVFRTSC